MLPIETFTSIVILGVGIWAACFLVPRAIHERDSLAITSAVLIALIAIALWLFLGTPMRSVAL